MRIAFYAPLKPPDHPVASGDRTVARGLIAALKLAGHDVEIASEFRSYNDGDAERQAKLRDEGERLAERYVREMSIGRSRPDVWFTYHLYHKAPDWIGPRVAAKLGIPYVIAEASFAPKQAGGRWDIGHRAVAEAIGCAEIVFQLNPNDAACVLPLMASSDRLAPLPPFLETSPFRAPKRQECRAAIGTSLDLDPEKPWLLTAAMMRDDQKLLSYKVLAGAMSKLTREPWQLVIAGAGPAEEKVRALFAPFADRTRWPGLLSSEELKRFYRAADLFVWPAIKEAFGMALLEAQAAGLPAVAGRSPGVASIVADGKTGLLATEGDAPAFAKAVGRLLADPEHRRSLGRAAARRAAREHDVSVVANILDQRIRHLFSAR
jgi:glycosyltransferase involved in cell wall biosynthesis